MAVIDNRLTEIGDVIVVKVTTASLGVVDAITYSESVSGETSDRYFIRMFRYSNDGVTYTPWLELSNANVDAMIVSPFYPLIIEYRYERGGSNPSGELVFDYVQINGTYQDVPVPQIYINSVFNKFFSYTDEEKMSWAINVLEKMYHRGTVPAYITRSLNDNENGEDKDYIDFFRSVCWYFSNFVRLARVFENMTSIPELASDYLRERGMYMDSLSDPSDMLYVITHYYSEIRKRGTMMVGIPKGSRQVVDGELLRTVFKGQNDEFIFNMLRPEHSGWYVDRSSPLYRGNYFSDLLIKGYENTKSVEDISLYPILAPSYVSIGSDEEPVTSSRRGLAAVGSGLAPYNHLNNGLTANGHNSDTLIQAISSDEYISIVVSPGELRPVTIKSLSFRPVSQNTTRTFTLFSSLIGFSEGEELGSCECNTDSGSSLTTILIPDHFSVSEPVEFRIYINGYGTAAEAVGIGNRTADPLQYDILVIGTDPDGEEEVDLYKWDFTGLGGASQVETPELVTVMVIGSVPVGVKSGIGLGGAIYPSQGGIVVDPRIDYEITFWVKASTTIDTNISFGCHAYNSSNSQVLLKRCTSGANSSNGSFFTPDGDVMPIIDESKWFFVRGIIYGHRTGVMSADDSRLDLGFGENLRFSPSVSKIAPYLYVDNSLGSSPSGDVSVWDFKVRPLNKPQAHGFVRSRNVIQLWLKNNNGEFLSEDVLVSDPHPITGGIIRSFPELEDFIKEYLLPYNSQLVINWLNE